MSQLRTNSIVPVGGIPAGASGGGIIQCVQVSQTETLSAGIIDWTDVSGLSLTITPRSSNNKVLICMFVNTGSSSANTGRYFRLVRNSTAISTGNGTPLGNESTTVADNTAANGNQMASTSMMFIDTPSTTSTITYKVQWKNTNNTIYLNRVTGTGGGSYGTAISTLIAMEVSG